MDEIKVGMNKIFSIKAVSCLEKNHMRSKKYSAFRHKLLYSTSLKSAYIF